MKEKLDPYLQPLYDALNDMIPPAKLQKYIEEDVYKTDVFVDVAEEVVAAIRGQEEDDAACERRKFRHKAHYSLNREDGIENDALNLSLIHI